MKGTIKHTVEMLLLLAVLRLGVRQHDGTMHDSTGQYQNYCTVRTRTSGLQIEQILRKIQSTFIHSSPNQSKSLKILTSMTAITRQ